jgi:hypothetical protein
MKLEYIDDLLEEIPESLFNLKKLLTESKDTIQRRKKAEKCFLDHM